MLVPLSWLRDFAPIDQSPSDLADVFDNLGLVVEGVSKVGEGLDGVVVGKVLGIRSHPNADHVRLADVDLGDGQPLQIACGASNLDVGQIVPVATIGAVLPGDFEISRRKLRGEWSNGMICSSDELGFANERAAGILVLSEDLVPGTPLKEALGIQEDVVYDLSIETNRPDAMCIAGVARDVAAKLKLPFVIPEYSPNIGAQDSADIASAVVDSPELCSRFTATVLTGGRVEPSSKLIASRLTLAGMRPINNVVDASNYVMLELGQPTHPYDLERLDGNGLIVRKAHPDESVVTLDEVERALGNEDCVICDAKGQPVGIGGIMGGASSEISESTSTLLLEAAYFAPVAIAKTSKRLGIRTEASVRFEKGCDPEGIERAVRRFASLLPEFEMAKTMVDVSSRDSSPRVISVRTKRVNAVLGTDLTDASVKEYLDPIGFATAISAPGELDVTIPSFRPDSEREIDVIEEVARHHGYTNIARTIATTTQVGHISDYQRDRRLVRQVLVGMGADEAWTTPMLGEDDFIRSGQPVNAVEVTNPLASEESLLRTTILPGLLKALSYNSARRNPNVRLFEVGHVFQLPEDRNSLPDEREHLAVALAYEDDDASSAMVTWRTLTDALRIDGMSVEQGGIPGLHPARSATLKSAEGVVLGQIGEVDPAVLEAYELQGRVGWLEVDLESLLALPRRPEAMRPVSRFPSSDIDLAFVVPEAVTAEQVERTLRSAGDDLIESVRLFDVYRGTALPDASRSLAYRLRFSALDRTLTDQEVAEVRSKCISQVEQSHRAKLR